LGAGKRSNEKAVGDKVKVLVCLKCDKKFNSYSKYNRICLECKRAPTFIFGMFYTKDEK